MDLVVIAQPRAYQKALISLHIRFCTGAVRKRIKSVAPIKEVEAQTSSSDVGIISGVGLVLFTTTVRNRSGQRNLLPSTKIVSSAMITFKS